MHIYGVHHLYRFLMPSEYYRNSLSRGFDSNSNCDFRFNYYYYVIRLDIYRDSNLRFDDYCIADCLYHYLDSDGTNSDYHSDSIDGHCDCGSIYNDSDSNGTNNNSSSFSSDCHGYCNIR
jgi:hypothetical protein